MTVDDVSSASPSLSVSAELMLTDVTKLTYSDERICVTQQFWRDSFG